jgi:hypothetical protein
MRPVLAPSLLLLLATACAPGLRLPGPTRVVGRDPQAPLIAVARPVPAPTEREEAGGEPRRRPPRDDFGRRVADAARHYLNHRLDDGFRNDCSGFVSASITRAGRPTVGSTQSLWEALDAEGRTHRRKRPEVGDLAFFDDTYDRNRDGRVNDPLTHVAVVLEVGDDGTILLAHGGTSAGHAELRMNLDAPERDRGEDGRVLNDILRRVRSTDPRGTRHLAGELWRGFATLPDAPDEG